MSEENKLQLLYCSLPVYFLLYNGSYYLYSPITASGARYRRSACIEYKSAIWTSCNSGLRHGLCVVYDASDQRWKDGKHVYMHKVVTVNTCCDVACQTFQLPHITTGSFQSHHHSKERNKPSFRWKSFAFHKLCGDIFRLGEQVDYSLFSSTITFLWAECFYFTVFKLSDDKCLWMFTECFTVQNACMQ